MVAILGTWIQFERIYRQFVSRKFRFDFFILYRINNVHARY